MFSAKDLKDLNNSGGLQELTEKILVDKYVKEIMDEILLTAYLGNNSGTTNCYKKLSGPVVKALTDAGYSVEVKDIDTSFMRVLTSVKIPEQVQLIITW